MKEQYGNICRFTCNIGRSENKSIKITATIKFR